MRLTEETLARDLERHRADCEDCESGGPCERPDEIEAAFWREVDRQIDEKKEKRHGS